MGKIIDISSKLTNEPTFLHVAEGKDYKVDDSKNTVFKIMQMWNADDISDMEKFDKTIGLALGKQASSEIDKMNLTINGFKSLAISILAVISGEDVEEFEKRFHESD